MKYGLSTRDYELISAYMDNQLSDKDRTQFEARLKVDPELGKELTELTNTRSMIRDLPRLRAPRNYYLKPEIIPLRPTLRLAPVFGIVSATASILLALVIFGSTFFKSNQPIAMAPAAPVVQETQPVQLQSQPELQRSAASPPPATEAPPALLLGAPGLQASPITSPEATQPLETQIPTPTTIYLFAYPPTSTPQGVSIMSGLQDQTTQEQCEIYYGGTAYPTLNSPDNCPTPTFTPTPSETSTPSELIQEFQPSSVTPSETPTSTETPTATSTETSTPTATPTSTPTPAPSETPTEMPPVVEKVAPTAEAASPAGLTAPSVAIDTVAPTPSGPAQAESTSPSSGSSFVNYLLLTVEISLASIAIIAGIIALAFRIRAGR
jgi:hypothetical protein